MDPETELEFDVYSLARIPRETPELLPEAPGLYFALDGAQRVWYIGQAISLRSRLLTHEKSPLFLQNAIQYFAWREVADKARRNDLERLYVERFAPPLNQLMVPRERPVLDLGLTPEAEIDRYFELKKQVAMIEFELNMLKANIVTRCEEQGGKIKLPDVQVFLSTRKNWGFSPRVEQLEQELRNVKTTEQADGTAVVKSVSVFPVVKATAKVGGAS